MEEGKEEGAEECRKEIFKKSKKMVRSPSKEGRGQWEKYRYRRTRRKSGSK